MTSQNQNRGPKRLRRSCLAWDIAPPPPNLCFAVATSPEHLRPMLEGAVRPDGNPQAVSAEQATVLVTHSGLPVLVEVNAPSRIVSRNPSGVLTSSISSSYQAPSHQSN